MHDIYSSVNVAVVVPSSSFALWLDPSKQKITAALFLKSNQLERQKETKKKKKLSIRTNLYTFLCIFQKSQKMAIGDKKTTRVIMSDEQSGAEQSRKEQIRGKEGKD